MDDTTLQVLVASGVTVALLIIRAGYLVRQEHEAWRRLRQDRQLAERFLADLDGVDSEPRLAA